MARKRKAQDAPATDGTPVVTYCGPLSAIVYDGRTFLSGVPQPVDTDRADAYARRTYFEVSYGDVLAG